MLKKDSYVLKTDTKDERTTKCYMKGTVGMAAMGIKIRIDITQVSYRMLPPYTVL